MPLFYPHKQTALIFIVCALIVLGTLWYVQGWNTHNQNAKNDMAAAQNIQVTQTGALFATTTDWQKQFFVPSTATPLKNGRKNTETAVSNEPETITGQFGKKFFEQYMLLKQNNLTEDQQAIQAVIDKNISDVIASAPQARVYDVRSIVMAADNDVAAEKTYANTIGGIIASYSPKGDAAIIATEALDQNDPTRVKEIEAIANSYSTMLGKLIEVPTPKVLGNQHVGLINGVSSMVFAAQGMSKVFSDPLQSLVSLAVYEKSLTSMHNALLDLKYEFSQKQIIFSNGESGAYFNLIN